MKHKVCGIQYLTNLLIEDVIKKKKDLENKPKDTHFISEYSLCQRLRGLLPVLRITTKRKENKLVTQKK